jgi:hypothetical protein
MAILSFDVGIKNLAYCLYEPETHSILAWENFQVTDNKLGSDMPIILAGALDRRWPSFKDARAIIIEQQPGSNKRMKVMEAYLHMYFVMKDMPVQLYHPRHKLEGVPGGGRGKSNYYHRKKAAVQETLEFFKEHPQSPEMMRVYNQAKKKDDVADCFLQALSYCRRPEGVVQANEIKKKKLRDDSNVKPRRPTQQQHEKGRYTKSVIKHMINNLRLDKGVMVIVEGNDALAAEKAKLEHQISKDKALAKNVKRFYQSPAACLEALYPEFRPPAEEKNIVLCKHEHENIQYEGRDEAQAHAGEEQQEEPDQ